MSARLEKYSWLKLFLFTVTNFLQQIEENMWIGNALNFQSDRKRIGMCDLNLLNYGILILMPAASVITGGTMPMHCG